MRKINLETWSRCEHFRVFKDWTYPHFNLCANLDLTAFYPFVKQRGISINIAIVYVLARAANEIPEFRYRIRVGEVVEHEVIHPSTTILTDDDLFSFCTIMYTEDFSVFADRAAQQIASVKAHRNLDDGLGQDDLLFMTTIPWVSFTSLMHPIHLDPPDSMPRIAWGKFFEDGESLKMPLSVQAHHALVDGLHLGRFYEKVGGYFDHPGTVLGEG
jgi:chloramphenicol O-acetyltransferase type A